MANQNTIQKSIQNRIKERHEGYVSDDNLFKLLKTHIKQSSATSYITRLNGLVELMNKNIFTFIMTPDLTYITVNKHYDSPSTKKNFLTSILAVFKYLQMQEGFTLNNTQKKALQRWHTFHKSLCVLEEEQYKSSEPTQKQQDKYVSFEDIKAKYLELKRKHRSIMHKNITSSMQFVFLSIVVHTPPKRCDYAQMKIYWNQDPHKNNENYVVLFDNKNNTNTALAKDSYFVFNVYKTSDNYNRVDQPITDELKEDIIESLKKFDREFLFVNRFKQPYANNSAFSKFVIRTFETLFDRPCGASMLRHIYISEVIDHNKWSDKEKEDLSRLMLHSTSLQNAYRWKSK